MEKIIKLPISIYMYDKAYEEAMEDYADKMEEYYRQLDKHDEDSELSRILGGTESMEKPKQPEGRKGEGTLVIKTELILGYEILGENIQLILDATKVAVSEPSYYIIKKDDKIIEKLDNILENNL